MDARRFRDYLYLHLSLCQRCKLPFVVLIPQWIHSNVFSFLPLLCPTNKPLFGEGLPLRLALNLARVFSDTGINLLFSQFARILALVTSVTGPLTCPLPPSPPSVLFLRMPVLLSFRPYHLTILRSIAKAPRFVRLDSSITIRVKSSGGCITSLLQCFHARFPEPLPI